MPTRFLIAVGSQEVFPTVSLGRCEALLSMLPRFRIKTRPIGVLVKSSIPSASLPEGILMCGGETGGQVLVVKVLRVAETRSVLGLQKCQTHMDPPFFSPR